MRVTEKGQLKTLLGIIISLFFISFLLVKVDFKASLEIILELNYKSLWLPIIVNIAALPFRPLRWKKIFSPASRPNFWGCFKANAIANMMNNILPARGGDFLRCFIISREKPFPNIPSVFSTLALEKIFDGIALLGVVLISFIYIAPPQWLKQLSIISFIIYGAAIIFIIGITRKTNFFLHLLNKTFCVIPTPRIRQALIELFQRFSEGFSGINSYSNLILILSLTVIAWASQAVIFWTMTPVLNFSIAVPEAFVIIAVLGLGLMIPAAPAFVGSYEFFVVSAMGLFGVAPDKALALAIVMHAWVIILTTILGTMALLANGFRSLTS